MWWAADVHMWCLALLHVAVGQQAATMTGQERLKAATPFEPGGSNILKGLLSGGLGS